jgi:hypothetical protein
MSGADGRTPVLPTIEMDVGVDLQRSGYEADEVLLFYPAKKWCPEKCSHLRLLLWEVPLPGSATAAWKLVNRMGVDPITTA